MPALIADAGDAAGWRYVEFFTANIRNPHTRRAYGRACGRFFAWCEDRGLTITVIRSHDVAAWVEQLQEKHGAPGVKQQLAAVRMLFDWLVTGQVVSTNPAAAVRGPKYVVTTGKTPVLDGSEWRRLLNAIPTDRECPENGGMTTASKPGKRHCHRAKQRRDVVPPPVLQVAMGCSGRAARPAAENVRLFPHKPTAHVERSPVAASLRARSIPAQQYRQHLPAGRSLSDLCSGSGHHPPSQSTATPIASPFPRSAIDPTDRTLCVVIPPFSGHSPGERRVRARGAGKWHKG